MVARVNNFLTILGVEDFGQKKGIPLWQHASITFRRFWGLRISDEKKVYLYGSMRQ